MQKGITKLKNILEGKPEPQFSSEDYMMLYTYASLSLPYFILAAAAGAVSFAAAAALGFPNSIRFDPVLI